MSDQKPPPQDPQDDSWLDELYAEVPDQNPPAELDRAILDAASKKLEYPVEKSQRSWLRLGPGLASAAVIVITIGIFMNQDSSSRLDEIVTTADGVTASLEARPRQQAAQPIAGSQATEDATLEETAPAARYQADSSPPSEQTKSSGRSANSPTKLNLSAKMTRAAAEPAPSPIASESPVRSVSDEIGAQPAKQHAAEPAEPAEEEDLQMSIASENTRALQAPQASLADTVERERPTLYKSEEIPLLSTQQELGQLSGLTLEEARIRELPYAQIEPSKYKINEIPCPTDDFCPLEIRHENCSDAYQIPHNSSNVATLGAAVIYQLEARDYQVRCLANGWTEQSNDSKRNAKAGQG